jgi:hypothetical protein
MQTVVRANAATDKPKKKLLGLDVANAYARAQEAV